MINSNNYIEIKQNTIYLSFVLLLIFICFSCSTNSIEQNIDWNYANEIISQIEIPKFPKKNYNVIEFGAKSDLLFDSKLAIQNAIDKCNENGGGKVIIPEGKYFCAGSIFIKSDVNLHLEKDSEIIFSTNSRDYLPLVLSRWEGVELYNYSALIYAKDQKNIAITGEGILNGNSNNKNWWWWKGKKEYGFKDGMPSQLDSLNRPLLLKMNNKNINLEQRIFGEGKYLRPNFLQTINCKDILIENVTFLDSPMWFLNPVLSENITVRGITVKGKGPNNDGLDPESCKNVLIENCDFDTGDDCIAIKSGRNNDGRRINIPSENIVIRNCKMKDGHGGIVIGSEISGGCKNIFVENCKMDSPNLERALRLKTNKFRGGIIENIFMKDCTIGEVFEAVVKLNLKYDEKTESGDIHFPIVKNIFIENINSKKSKYAFYFDGLEQSQIENIYIKNSNLNGVSEKSILNNVKNISMENVFINNDIYKN
ncbi:MAG: glycoside hydrolase family 28 protein [Ignavibacteriae bacterium]|nr:glycoside hydrolase family 28 protein [Ignavibacteriota bacterium]